MYIYIYINAMKFEMGNLGLQLNLNVKKHNIFSKTVQLYPLLPPPICS